MVSQIDLAEEQQAFTGVDLALVPLSLASWAAVAVGMRATSAAN